MNRLKSPLRRGLAIAAGALIGASGALALASPAAAHHPEPSGTYCLASDGSVVVSWTVGNSEDDLEGKITKLESNVPAAFEGTLQLGAVLPKKGEDLTATQTHKFDGEAPAEITLTVGAEWKRDYRTVTKEKTKKAKPAGECEPGPEPSPSPSPEPSDSPSPPESTPTPSPEPEPGEPVFGIEETCDDITFTVDNPADGVEFELIFTPSVGEPQTLVATPGAGEQSVTFPASEGLTVTISAEGVDETETIAYERPEDCDAGGGGGGLPVTGAAAGGIAAGAAGLLAVGAVLFFMARRRRVTFTA